MSPQTGDAYHRVGQKYILSVVHAAQCMPVLIPALGDWYDSADLMPRLDGLLLTGSPSNVEPERYGGGRSRAGTAHDAARDATTLPAIRGALDSGVPLFAICRGHQELNVALGGTLHQNVHELPGKRDHRSNKSLPYDDRYRACHRISIREGGVLRALNGGADTALVNSLHAQAIDRLADRLEIEAVSEDGVIEATSVTVARAFALSVQWHPEHPVALDWPLSRAMFAAFGDACRNRHAGRGGAERRGGRRRNNAA